MREWSLFTIMIQATPDIGMEEKPAGDDSGPADEQDNEGAFQGDMMLTEDQRAEIEAAVDDLGTDRKKRKATVYSNYRWPEKILPYVITNSSGTRIILV